MSYPVAEIRARFPQLERRVHEKSLVYLDNAATTLKPRQVIDRITQFYTNEVANVHRGAHFISNEGTAFYEQAREVVREFLNASSSDEIVFTRGTTESINLVADTFARSILKPGDEILLTELEHHSNIVPWQRIAEQTGAVVRFAPVNERGEVEIEAFTRLLSAKTKMVSIAWCSNTLGTILPIKEIIESSHSVGAKVMLDAAQAVAHLPTDVQALNCDFLAFSGHKIFAPFGIGVLFGKREWLDQMPPYQTGGSMIGTVTFEKSTFALPPQKFEAGTPNVAGALALAEAIKFVNQIGLSAIAKHQHELLQYATWQIRDIPGSRIVGEAHEKGAIVSFVFDGIHPSDLGSIIDREGVAIRTGHHCTQPLLAKLGLSATARASFSIYNTFSEIDVLKQSLLKAKEFF